VNRAATLAASTTAEVISEQREERRPKLGDPLRRPGVVDYLRHLLVVAIFYFGGLWLTVRVWIFPATCRASPEGWAEARGRFAVLLRRYFALLEKWGLLLVEDHLAEGTPLPRGTILVANHPGLFDALLLLRQWPDSSCVMRAGLMSSPTFHGTARACGFLPNDTGADFIREAVARLRSGENLIVFPEGTRTLPGGPLLQFKKGFALAARRSGAPIQTILLEHRGEFLRKGGPILRPSWLPLQIRLRRGRFFSSEETSRAGLTTEALADEVESYFRRELPNGGFVS
jgi:1-acyl-sn-glycerol-3-phosphate acyltransferase